MIKYLNYLISLFWIQLFILLNYGIAEKPKDQTEGSENENVVTDKSPQSSIENPNDQTQTTEHKVTIDGEIIHYTATAGTLVLKKENGEAEASIFYIAYTKNEKSFK